MLGGGPGADFLEFIIQQSREMNCTTLDIIERYDNIEYALQGGYNMYLNAKQKD